MAQIFKLRSGKPVGGKTYPRAFERSVPILLAIVGALMTVVFVAVVLILAGAWRFS